jgi:hypothetical protein
MLTKLAAAALGVVVLSAAPAFAGDDGHRRKHHKQHQKHHHHQSWHGHHYGHGGHHNRHRHGSSVRIVLWHPAPVYRAYPAPVYVPAPVAYEPIANAVPLRNFQDANGRYCREYQRTADIGGVRQQIYGTACMMPDGSWQIVSE